MKLSRLFALLSVSGCLFVSNGCVPPDSATSEPVEKRAAASSLDRVFAGPPIRKSLQLFTQQPGRIEAFEEAPMFPKFAGYVERMAVDIGDRVEQGDLLIKLAIPELQDELEQKQGLVAQAEAEVKQATAALEASKAAANSAKALVTQAQASRGRVEGDFSRWSSEAERIKQLVASGSVTSKLADETLNQLRAADSARAEIAASIESAIAGEREAEANIAKAEADLVAATARVRVAQANVATAQTMLGYTEIRSPFAGVVTERNADTGHYVHPANAANAKPLVTVASTDRVRVYVDIPEMEAGLLDAGYNKDDAGDMAVVRVQSLNNQAFEGRVTRSSWSLDAQNRSLRAEIDLPNEGHRMLPGGFATVSILLDQRDDVLTLPIVAIIRDGDKAFCCIVIDGKIQRKAIELGLRSGNEVEVVSGLTGTETVVLANSASLQEGQQVEIIEKSQK